MAADLQQLSIFDLMVAPANEISPAQRPAFSKVEFLAKVEQILPDDVPYFRGIYSELAMIELAEDEIDQAQARHPEAADLIKSCFLPLKPSQFLNGAPDMVYRAHVRELLDRVAQGQPLAPGTGVEIMMVLKECSFIAPLNSDATGLYLKLFQDAFGQEMAGKMLKAAVMDLPKPSYRGAWDEYLDTLRRKTADSWRAENWDKQHRPKKKFLNSAEI